MTRGDSEFVTGFWTSPTGVPQSGMPLIRQPVRSCLRQLLFGRLFTWPADQPRHAAYASTYPVEPSSPPVRQDAVTILASVLRG
jgi:hypothetical protein